MVRKWFVGRQTDGHTYIIIHAGRQYNSPHIILKCTWTKCTTSDTFIHIIMSAINISDNFMSAVHVSLIEKYMQHSQSGKGCTSVHGGRQYSVPVLSYHRRRYSVGLMRVDSIGGLSSRRKRICSSLCSYAVSGRLYCLLFWWWFLVRVD